MGKLLGMAEEIRRLSLKQRSAEDQRGLKRAENIVEVALNVPASTVMIKAARFGQFSLAIALLSVGLSPATNSGRSFGAGRRWRPANGNLAPADGSVANFELSAPPRKRLMPRWRKAQLQPSRLTNPHRSPVLRPGILTRITKRSRLLRAGRWKPLSPTPAPRLQPPECPGDNYIWNARLLELCVGGYYWCPAHG